MRRLLEKYKRLIRFVVTGFLNTGIDYAVFYLLKGLFLVADNSLCQVAGYVAGTLNSFVMNKLWTFENKEKGKNTASQAGKFLVINAMSLGAGIVTLNFFNIQVGMNVYIAKGFATIVSWVINYTGYRLWVFRSKE